MAVIILRWDPDLFQAVILDSDTAEIFEACHMFSLFMAFRMRCHTAHDRDTFKVLNLLPPMPIWLTMSQSTLDYPNYICRIAFFCAFWSQRDNSFYVLIVFLVDLVFLPIFCLNFWNLEIILVINPLITLKCMVRIDCTISISWPLSKPQTQHILRTKTMRSAEGANSTLKSIIKLPWNRLPFE